jgi:hypothetical protein
MVGRSPKKQGSPIPIKKGKGKGENAARESSDDESSDQDAHQDEELKAKLKEDVKTVEAAVVKKFCEMVGIAEGTDPHEEYCAVVSVCGLWMIRRVSAAPAVCSDIA